MFSKGMDGTFYDAREGDTLDTYSAILLLQATPLAVPLRTPNNVAAQPSLCRLLTSR
jgi:hypothetical protein